jgi:hypothetical protein
MKVDEVIVQLLQIVAIKDVQIDDDDGSDDDEES